MLYDYIDEIVGWHFVLDGRTRNGITEYKIIKGMNDKSIYYANPLSERNYSSGWTEKFIKRRHNDNRICNHPKNQPFVSKGNKS
jgi:hypothetical protein